MFPEIIDPTRKKLPNPATLADEFAHATVVELRRINDNIEDLVATLKQAMKPSVEELDGNIDLREPTIANAAKDADAPLTVETVTVKPPHRDAIKKGTKDAPAE